MSDSRQSSFGWTVNLEKASGARSTRRRLIDKGDPRNDYHSVGSERALSITCLLDPSDRRLEARAVNSCVIWTTVGYSLIAIRSKMSFQRYPHKNDPIVGRRSDSSSVPIPLTRDNKETWELFPQNAVRASTC